MKLKTNKWQHTKYQTIVLANIFYNLNYSLKIYFHSDTCLMMLMWFYCFHLFTQQQKYIQIFVIFHNNYSYVYSILILTSNYF